MEELARESISLLASTSAKPPLDVGPRLGSMGAVFIMLKSALGAGLLNFPWAFARAGGVRSAVTVELISLVFLISGLIILGYSSSISRQHTYQAVVKELCGTAIGQLCEICFIFNLFMISVAFLVVVNDQLEKLCNTLYELVTALPKSEMPYHFYTDHRFALVLLCFFLIMPMSIPKEILPTEEFLFSQCHEASIAIYSSMENQRLSHWAFVSVVAMIICLIIYSLTGVYGYLTFGKTVAPDILMSYSNHDKLMLVARLLFGVSIITIYPIIVLLGRSVIQDPLLSRWRRRDEALMVKFECRSRWVLTVLWIMTTLLIAVFVPDISKVISVIGGISAFFIFIFPGRDLVIITLTIWGAVTLICGAFIFGQSTTVAVMELLGKI
uniref:Amino acid transporter transmembrane domain-containing protein n=1 Tax=Xiphophorus couchianus TaxID=32473 RepID=A0A3B5MZM3_9TELE